MEITQWISGFVGVGIIVLFQSFSIRTTTVIPLTMAIALWVPFCTLVTRLFLRYDPSSRQLALFEARTRIDRTMLLSLAMLAVGSWGGYLLIEHQWTRMLFVFITSFLVSSLFFACLHWQERPRIQRLAYRQRIISITCLYSLFVWTLAYWRIGEYFFDLTILAVTSVVFIFVTYVHIHWGFQALNVLQCIDRTVMLGITFMVFSWLPLQLWTRVFVVFGLGILSIGWGRSLFVSAAVSIEQEPLEFD